MPRALASLQSVAIDGLVCACSTCTSIPLLRPARRASSRLAPAAAGAPLAQVGGQRGLDRGAGRSCGQYSGPSAQFDIIAGCSLDRLAVAADVHALRPDFAVLRDGRHRRRQRPRRRRVRGLAARRRDARAAAGPTLPAHVAAWQEAYRAFGAKPQRTASSVEALWKRAAGRRRCRASTGWSTSTTRSASGTCCRSAARTSRASPGRSG